ncbi:MAG: transposase [Candidatus Omnitrophica bacterium]|nr:transposase [Candidatus Omnitrophota bacterium]
MPRAARTLPQSGYLHVICRGNNHKKIFYSQSDFRIFYKIAYALKLEEGIKILHYCFMPNHVHFLIGLTKKSQLARFMKRLCLKYFYSYQRKYAYSGHLWHSRFKSKIIEDDAYFIQCGKYIELNPVRASLVKQPQDYLFSSYRYYAQGTQDKLIDTDPFYLTLADTPEERQQHYQKTIINEIVQGVLY